MNIIKNKRGFTLMELLIVIIIIFVLISIGLPKLLTTVEFSKSAEAGSIMSSIRRALEGCYLLAGGNYASCTLDTISMENPNAQDGRRFNYTVAGGAASYTIIAIRNTADGGDGSSQIIVQQTTAGVTRSGTTKFQGIR